VSQSRAAVARVGTIREPRGRGTSAVGIRYQATASEDVTVRTSVCVFNIEL
jgi:hypothetical protein